MLPTLGFILCAYGIYAICRAWSRRHRRQVRYCSRWRGGGRLTLVGATGVGVGLIIFISILGLPSRYDNITSASIISTSWGHDPQGSGQTPARQENLPIKNQGEPGRPIYAYLHPETPSSQLLPEETAPGTRSLHKPKFLKPRLHGKAKARKAVSRASKKYRASGKIRLKKKKPHSPAGRMSAHPG